jgi:hypothetical protein
MSRTVKRQTIKKRRPRMRRTRNYSKRQRMRGLRGGNPGPVFYCLNHYGDNLFNLKFIYNVSSKLKEKGTKIVYFYDPKYIKNVDELKRYVDSDVVTLKTGNLPKNAIQLWMGNPIDNKAMLNLPRNIGKNISQKTPIVSSEEYYDLFYKKMLTQMGLEGLGIDTSLFQEEPYLNKIYRGLDSKFKDLDILIINAEPMSGQIKYDKGKFNEMCIQLASKHKVATTSHVDGDEYIPCTMRDKLMLQDIGAVSTHAKYIIAVHSGPLVPCYNAETKRHVKKWIIFTDYNVFHSEINALVFKTGYDYSKIEEDLFS